ncbi:MAG: hypothetical protein ACE366_30905 [Bradymonadia bacterium]
MSHWKWIGGCLCILVQAFGCSKPAAIRLKEVRVTPNGSEKASPKGDTKKKMRAADFQEDVLSKIVMHGGGDPASCELTIQIWRESDRKDITDINQFKDIEDIKRLESDDKGDKNWKQNLELFTQRVCIKKTGEGIIVPRGIPLFFDDSIGLNNPSDKYCIDSDSTDCTSEDVVEGICKATKDKEGKKNQKENAYAKAEFVHMQKEGDEDKTRIRTCPMIWKYHHDVGYHIRLQTVNNTDIKDFAKYISVLRNDDVVFFKDITSSQNSKNDRVTIKIHELKKRHMPFRADFSLRIWPEDASKPSEDFEAEYTAYVESNSDLRPFQDIIDAAKKAIEQTPELKKIKDDIKNDYECITGNASHIKKTLEWLGKGMVGQQPSTPQHLSNCRDAIDESNLLNALNAYRNVLSDIESKTNKELKNAEKALDQAIDKLEPLYRDIANEAKQAVEKKIEKKIKELKEDPAVLNAKERIDQIKNDTESFMSSIDNVDVSLKIIIGKMKAAKMRVASLRKAVKDPEVQARFYTNFAKALPQASSVLIERKENRAPPPGIVSTNWFYEDKDQWYSLLAWNGITSRVSVDSKLELNAEDVVPMIDLIGFRWVPHQSTYLGFGFGGYMQSESYTLEATEGEEKETDEFIIAGPQFNIFVNSLRLGVGYNLTRVPSAVEHHTRMNKGWNRARLIVGVELYNLFTDDHLEAF